MARPSRSTFTQNVTKSGVGDCSAEAVTRIRSSPALNKCPVATRSGPSIRGCSKGTFGGQTVISNWRLAINTAVVAHGLEFYPAQLAASGRCLEVNTSD